MDYSGFIIGGLSSVGATLLTHPLEVIKTRIQLQGELAAKGSYVEPYKGVLNAFVTVAKHDGILTLQKGLVPALCYQFIFNTLRFGVCNTAIQNQWTQNSSGNFSFSRMFIWGASGGIIGSLVSSPLLLIKTQIQSQASKKIAVGYQHKHTGMFQAMNNIYTKYGLLGLWRNVLSVIPRSAIGGGTQIATYNLIKDFLGRNKIVAHPTYILFLSSAITGSLSSIIINPLDVITTRLYNQGVDEKGKGIYYKGFTDCFYKILKAEGFYGFYKGLWANYIRLVPQVILTFVCFDMLLYFLDNYRKKTQL